MRRVSNVVQLRRPAPRPHTYPKPAPSGTVYSCRAQGGGWLVVDMSASGDSAGMHGVFRTEAEADAEGRRVAAELNRIFVEAPAPGGAA